MQEIDYVAYVELDRRLLSTDADKKTKNKTKDLNTRHPCKNMLLK